MTPPPVLLTKWYEFSKWVLEKVDNLPKNQRFILGQRLADGVLDIQALLVEAAYSPQKRLLLEDANRRLEVLRWLVRMLRDRNLLAAKQFRYASESMTECGRMLGGWIKQAK